MVDVAFSRLCQIELIFNHQRADSHLRSFTYALVLIVLSHEASSVMVGFCECYDKSAGELTEIVAERADYISHQELQSEIVTSVIFTRDVKYPNSGHQESRRPSVDHWHARFTYG